MMSAVCKLRLVGAVGLMLLSAQTASAQTYPSQPVRLIVPFTAGTGMDTIARAVAPKLAERLGQGVVVQNVPGASGNIGTDQVAKGADNSMVPCAQVFMAASTVASLGQPSESVLAIQ